MLSPENHISRQMSRGLGNDNYEETVICIWESSMTYAKHLLGNQCVDGVSAEDLASEAINVVLEKNVIRKGLGSIGEVVSFARTVVQRRYADIFRKRNSHAKYVDQFQFKRSCDPALEVFERETNQHFQRVYKKTLTSSERLTFRLRYDCGKSTKEIAKLLNIGQRAVQIRLKDGGDRLKEQCRIIELR